jgi:virginiamycin B lyase
MKHRLLSLLFLVGTAATLAACSGGGTSPVPSAPAPQPPSNNGPSLQVGPFTATFTEFPLPAGQSGPGDITVGPDGAVWFAVNNGIDRIVGGGAITNFAPPAGTNGVFGGIASAGGALLYGVDGFFNGDPEPEQWFVQQPPSGTSSLLSALPPDSAFQHLRTAPDRSHVWAGVNVFNITGSVISPTGGEVDLPQNFFPNDIAFSEDGDIYVTAAGLGPPDSVVFKIAAGAIAHQFNLPDGSAPTGIALGPDGAFWITLTGSNSIGRLTTGGTLTQFALPTANSSPIQIIKGNDDALWFTEQTGNKIGRITTSGTITEYTVPTPNAKPFGLTACPLQCDNAHERIWFTENAANKVGEFVF